jgi:hypothetical protein
VFFSIWYLSDEVFEKAEAYFFWTEETEARSMVDGI